MAAEGVAYIRWTGDAMQYHRIYTCDYDRCHRVRGDVVCSYEHLMRHLGPGLFDHTDPNAHILEYFQEILCTTCYGCVVASHISGRSPVDLIKYVRLILGAYNDSDTLVGPITARRIQPSDADLELCLEFADGAQLELTSCRMNEHPFDASVNRTWRVFGGPEALELVAEILDVPAREESSKEIEEPPF